MKSKLTKDGSGMKTPRGWKKVADGVRCGQCTRAAFVMRSVRLRIIGPHDSEPREAKELWQAMCRASGELADFANGYLQKLMAADPALAFDSPDKMPALPEVDYYSAAVTAFQNIAPRSLCQAAQAVRSYYVQERFACLAQKNRNVRSYRWDGLPIPVHNQAWRLESIDEKEIVLRLQVGPGKSWTLKVFADGVNLARMRQLLSGEGERGAAVLMRRRRQPRPGETTVRRSWFLKIAGNFPRVEPKRRESHKEITLTLGHDAESLLFGAIEGDEECFEFPGVDVRKMIVGFDRTDAKRQVEASLKWGLWPKRKSKRWAQDRAAQCAKQAKKVEAQVKLAAAALASWCKARGVTSVDYDTADRGFVPHFPWQALRLSIQSALENIGVALHVVGSEEQNTSEQVALAEPGATTADGA
jgi:hypothetical protein